MPAESVPTAYGDIEYETVRCDYCGSKTIVEDAVGVVVGGGTDQRFAGNIRISGGEPYNFCPECAEVLFDYTGGGGAIPVSWRALTHRAMNLEDPAFAAMFGFIGATMGVMVGYGILAVLAWAVSLL